MKIVKADFENVKLSTNDELMQVQERIAVDINKTREDIKAKTTLLLAVATELNRRCA